MKLIGWNNKHEIVYGNKPKKNWHSWIELSESERISLRELIALSRNYHNATSLPYKLICAKNLQTERQYHIDIHKDNALFAHMLSEIIL